MKNIKNITVYGIPDGSRSAFSDALVRVCDVESVEYDPPAPAGDAVIDARTHSAKDTASDTSASVPSFTIALPIRIGHIADTLAAIRRSNAQTVCADVRTWHGLKLDPVEKHITDMNTDASARLTDKEIALLAVLIDASGTAIPKQRILETVWGYADGVTTHTLETHVYRLRRKLSDAGITPDLIKTDEEGYRIHAPE